MKSTKDTAGNTKAPSSSNKGPWDTDSKGTGSTRTGMANAPETTSATRDSSCQATKANQAYTFNGTTAHPNMSYTPGTVNMGPMHQTWGYQTQDNQYQPYHNQFGTKQQTLTFNSFAQGNNTQTAHKNTTENTNSIIDQMAKLLNSLKATTDQVQEVQAQPTAELWDLAQVSELPQNSIEDLEWLAKDQHKQAQTKQNTPDMKRWKQK